MNTRLGAPRGWRGFVWLAAAACTALAGCGAEPAEEKRVDIFPIRLDTLEKQRITTGRAKLAADYYKRLGDSLSFSNHEPPESLDVLLRYFGYEKLTAHDLDTLEPAKLMDREAMLKQYPDAPELAEGDWDLLAARYFSPKTSDVSGKSNKMSWRKVVRLKPRPGSPAAADRLSALYFLSVLYVEESDQDPFQAPSLNIQVIVARDPEEKQSKLEDPIAFFVFDPNLDYELGYATTTSWDAADPELCKGLQPYYLPDACIQCHGGADIELGTPQFFDTDYILDKAEGVDFRQRIGDNPALFDAGNDPSAAKYRDAFEVFRKLNREIREHNRAVDPQALSTLGADNWMRLHEASDEHAPPIERGWLSSGNEWHKDNPLHEELVPLLNRYCYRCHGTIYYNVFNKHDKLGVQQGVEDWVGMMAENVEAGRMPLDRRLSKSEQAEIAGRLRKFEAQLAPPGERDQP